MKREIKFRAKRLNEDQWCYGAPICSVNDRTYMVHGATEDAINTLNKLDFIYTEVDTDTIGQFTGLTDKNGKEIYEGDIVLQQGYHGKKIPMVVKFECGAFIVGYHNGSSTKRRPMLLNGQCEVIGAIYDNANLLEK